ncbi:hypothetical protein CCACVL1_26399, partial [Corchorus capsularis]
KFLHSQLLHSLGNQNKSLLIRNQNESLGLILVPDEKGFILVRDKGLTSEEKEAGNEETS